MNKDSKNTHIRSFRNDKALSIVKQVFRCYTHEIVLFQTLFTMLYIPFCSTRDVSPIQLLDFLCSLLLQVAAVVAHVESDYIKKGQSELMKQDFIELINTLKGSGPVPSLGRSCEKFSRLIAVHIWFIDSCHS